MYCRFDRFSFSKEFFEIKNYVLHTVKDDLVYRRFPIEIDSELGWKPKPGNYSSENPWNNSKPIELIIKPNGMRSSGLPIKINNSLGKKILFSGDSFTFGDGVSDNETFPSFFESLVKQPVLNSGVSAYGIDQSYLRALKIIENEQISDLFFCFISDDIFRCEYNIRHRLKKPYFIIEEETIKLVRINNNDIRDIEAFNMMFFHKIGGYSLFINRVMWAILPDFWINSTPKPKHNYGHKISLKLINSIFEICKEREINFYLVPLSWGSKGYVDPHKMALDYILENIDTNINVIDVNKYMFKIFRENKNLHDSFFPIANNGHYSPTANEFVANFIFSNIKKSNNADIKD